MRKGAGPLVRASGRWGWLQLLQAQAQERLQFTNGVSAVKQLFLQSYLPPPFIPFLIRASVFYLQSE